jgi:hypothetical protein
LTDSRAESPSKTLRRLFLTLFLRGRGARGLRREIAPKSIGDKLKLTLGFYALFGCFALLFHGQSVFALGVYLHAMTFMFLGMFVASSAGEVLFNKEETDILLHRPVEPKMLLRAKVRVLVEVSLWLAGAFNLVGLFVGLTAPDGDWRFPFAHALSTTLEALFCTGTVVLGYQLCLSWFGRERLEGLMTTMQVIVSVAAVLSGQILPRVMIRPGFAAHFGIGSWWIGLLPPAWFAGLDDALAGSSVTSSWLLGLLAVAVTAAVLAMAFGRLAQTYESGLRSLNESVSKRVRNSGKRRWLDLLANESPIRWWFLDPVSRASFVLTGAYLFRDRDVKLRVYPGIAPMLVMPLIMLLQGRGRGGLNGFLIAFAGSYLGMIPYLGLNLLQYSQQWQASDVFRAAPMVGPAPLCRGARWAVLCFLTVPILIIFGLMIWLLQGGRADWILLLPGVVTLPIYALLPNMRGGAVPLSLPTEEAKSAGRGLLMFGVMFVSAAVSGLAVWAQSVGWFWPFLLAESLVSIFVCLWMSRSIAAIPWPSME